jgi:hypothetical protein
MGNTWENVLIGRTRRLHMGYLTECSVSTRLGAKARWTSLTGPVIVACQWNCALLAGKEVWKRHR